MYVFVGQSQLCTYFLCSMMGNNNIRLVPVVLLDNMNKEHCVVRKRLFCVQWLQSIWIYVVVQGERFHSRKECSCFRIFSVNSSCQNSPLSIPFLRFPWIKPHQLHY